MTKGYLRRTWFLALGGILLLSSLAGCGGEGRQETQAEGSELTVLAAASLTDAFKDLAAMFEEQNSGAKANLSFGASSALLTQIQQGAPADVFASADEAKMNTAVQEALVRDPAIFVRNRPVVILPRDNPARIRGFQDLAKPGARLVLEQDGVPIAEYAKNILRNANSEYGEGFEQRVFDRLVSSEADVRAAANRVALGEADGTFVYITDVTPDIEDQVEVKEVPENLNVTATYPIATVKASKNPELPQRWVDLVLSDEGQGVLQKYGFEPAAGS